MQSERVIKKYKENFKEKWGVGFPSQVKFYCKEYNKHSTGLSHKTKYHKNHNVTVFMANGLETEYTKHLD